MIGIRPYEDLAAMAVFRRLDVHDQIEAELVRGVSCTALALFADWRAAQAQGPLSLVAVSGPAARPFAVLCLGNTGQAGVGQAALLACDHTRHRTDLARLAVAIRADMPGWCAARGIFRLEARCWAGHPTASALLASIGFVHDCDMAGFGGQTRATFRQFAWTAPPAPPADHPPLAIDLDPIPPEVPDVHA